MILEVNCSLSKCFELLLMSISLSGLLHIYILFKAQLYLSLYKDLHWRSGSMAEGQSDKGKYVLSVSSCV